MRISSEEHQRQFRTIYEIVSTTPRVSYRTLAKILEINKKTAGLRFQEALEEQVIMGPQLRKKSFENVKEYMYFVTCKDPGPLYLSYRENPDIIYHAKTMGFCNLWVVAKEHTDIPGEIMYEGYRSDYYISYAPDRTWDTAMKIIDKKVKEFDTNNYVHQDFIQNHCGETIVWDEKDQLLFGYFKYNLRNPLSELMKNRGISSERIYRFLRRLPDDCTVSTAYYPEGFLSYDPYLFMIETDYEDFIIDLFSQLPTTSTFFTVGKELFAYITLSKKYMYTKDLNVIPRKFYIPSILCGLQDREIVKRAEYTIVEYVWGKDD